MAPTERKIRQDKGAVIRGGCLWIGFAEEFAEPHLGVVDGELSFVSYNAAQGRAMVKDKERVAGVEIRELQQIVRTNRAFVAVVAETGLRKIGMLYAEVEITVGGRGAAKSPAAGGICSGDGQIFSGEPGALALKLAPTGVAGALELNEDLSIAQRLASIVGNEPADSRASWHLQDIVLRQRVGTVRTATDEAALFVAIGENPEHQHEWVRRADGNLTPAFAVSDQVGANVYVVTVLSRDSENHGAGNSFACSGVNRLEFNDRAIIGRGTRRIADRIRDRVGWIPRYAG